MTAPDPGQITVSLEAMHSDAVLWRQIAAEMREAARIADRLDLGAMHFSFVANLLGMVDLYRDTQDRVLALLGEAARAHEWLAVALDTAANNYYVDDSAGADRLRQIQ